DAAGNVSPASGGLKVIIGDPIAPVSIGTKGDETANSTSLAITGVVAPGDRIIVVFAMDDPAGSPPFGAVSASDGFNVYSVDQDVWNAKTGTAADGVRTVVLSAQVTTPLGGGTITINHPSVTARAANVFLVPGLLDALPL